MVVDGEMDGWVGRWIVEWAERWMNGWMDGWVGVWDEEAYSSMCGWKHWSPDDLLLLNTFPI